MQNFLPGKSIFKEFERLTPCISLAVSLVLVSVLLVSSLLFRHVVNPDLIEGTHAAPDGSSITLVVKPVTTGTLAVGQKTMFSFTVNYVLNAEHGKVKLIMQTTPDECSWRVIKSDVIRGSGKLFENITLGYDNIPQTTEIRFVALLAGKDQIDTSTKAVVAFPVTRQNASRVSEWKTKACIS